jgi:hypothetical protein
VTLEKERMQRVKECRFAEFIGLGEHGDAVAYLAKARALACETADVGEFDDPEPHARTS